MTNPLLHRLGSTPVGAFAVQTGVVLAIFTTLVFAGIWWRTSSLVLQAVEQQAASDIQVVVATRAWNAEHGGVWVVRTPSSPSNTYLRELGIEPDTTTVSGTVLTLRNPAVMTREVSERLAEDGGLVVRLTSLDPVNPGNAPDDWEREVLGGFESVPETVTTVERRGGSRSFRMLVPLTTTEACLPCHASQGYSVGDVRGAISVAIPLAAQDAGLRDQALTLAGLWLIVMVLVGSTVLALIWRLARRVDRAEHRLRETALTDELTGLRNRRAIMSRLVSELARARRSNALVGVVMLDIDHFKAVNDTHGHAAGDAVLKGVADRLAEAVREYDEVGRIGGEEFLVVWADLDAEDLPEVAERVRCAAGGSITFDGIEIAVTASAGAALSDDPTEPPDQILQRADEALYRAKQAGRDRLELS